MSKRMSLTEWAGLTKEEYRALTAAERKQLKDDRARSETKTWRPEANDLALAHIPETDRERIRTRLSPRLANLTDTSGKRIGVKGGDCWHVAQALVFTANDPDVKYVEGVWKRGYQLKNDETPVPHAWALVDGYRVDLIEEFYSWSTGDDDWVHEPLEVYSWEELMRAVAFDAETLAPMIRNALGEDRPLCEISSIVKRHPDGELWVIGRGDGLMDSERAFAPAIKRLQERYAREHAKEVAA